MAAGLDEKTQRIPAGTKLTTAEGSYRTSLRACQGGVRQRGDRAVRGEMPKQCDAVHSITLVSIASQSFCEWAQRPCWYHQWYIHLWHHLPHTLCTSDTTRSPHSVHYTDTTFSPHLHQVSLYYGCPSCFHWLLTDDDAVHRNVA